MGVRYVCKNASARTYVQIGKSAGVYVQNMAKMQCKHDECMQGCKCSNVGASRGQMQQKYKANMQLINKGSKCSFRKLMG